MKGSWKRISERRWEYQTEDGVIHGLIECSAKAKDPTSFKSSDPHTDHVQVHKTLSGAMLTVETNLKELLDDTASLRD